MNSDLQEGDFREGLEDADDEDDDEHVNGDMGPLPLSMPKLISGIAEEVCGSIACAETLLYCAMLSFLIATHFFLSRTY